MALQYQEEITITEDTFTLPFPSVKKEDLLVFLNGQLLTAPDDYVHLSQTTIRLTDPAEPGEMIRFYAEDKASTGLITTANVADGFLSVSYLAVDKESDILDLRLRVYNTSGTEIISPTILYEFGSSGVYYTKVNVGTAPGYYLAEVTSLDRPRNNTAKVFEVQFQPKGFNIMQEVTRQLGETVKFKHIASPGLSDVKITIYDDKDNKIINNKQMSEIDNSGVFRYSFKLVSSGIYTAIMHSLSAQTRSVIEIKAISPPTKTTFNVAGVT